jgi:hypothetical protein
MIAMTGTGMIVIENGGASASELDRIGRTRESVIVVVKSANEHTLEIRM